MNSPRVPERLDLASRFGRYTSPVAPWRLEGFESMRRATVPNKQRTESSYEPDRDAGTAGPPATATGWRVLLRLALTLLIVELATGCGAMFNSSATTIRVNAQPTGARVYIDGLYAAPSPAEITVTTADPHSLSVQAEGYEPQTTRLESRVGGGYVVLDCLLLLLFVVPGILALVVDGATGDWRSVEAGEMDIRLTPAAPAAPAFPARPIPNAGGCQYDTQCKGDRICLNGQCVDRPPTSPSHMDVPRG